VQLWSDGFYATPGLSWDRETLQGHPFYYFAYGAAVSEVVVDTLTGERKLLRADMLHDAGQSLNPAIDIGQIEGAFIQGMGWLTSEELVWHPADGSPRPAADHARAQHLQDPHRQRLPADFTRAAVRPAQPARQHPPQQGRGRAAAAAALLGVLRHPRRGLGRGRPPRGPAAAAPATPEAILRAITAVQRPPLERRRPARHRAALAGRRPPGVVVEVIAHAGSVPREAGTRMLVAADAVLGTIGGGHLELQAIADARSLLAGHAARASSTSPWARAWASAAAVRWTCASRRWPTRPCRPGRSRRATVHLQLYGAGHVGRAIVRCWPACLPGAVDRRARRPSSRARALPAPHRGAASNRCRPRWPPRRRVPSTWC
jgi:hypothetical protein